MSCLGLAGRECLSRSRYRLHSNGGKYFSRLAPIGPQIAKKSRSYFHEAVFWRQTYVVDICGGRICGLQCLVIASQHGGGWGRMGISQLRYRYCSPPFCVRVGDGWGYCSSILCNCDIGIAAVILISQLRYLYRSFVFRV